MPFNSCPGCQYDEKRNQERVRRRQQNRKLKEKETKPLDNHDRNRPDTIPEGPEEWETGEEREEEFMDMVDAFMSRAYLYTKTMKEMMTMDREKGRQAGKVLAGIAGNPSMMGQMNEKKKKRRDVKGKKAERRSSRTQVKGDRSGKMKEHQPSGSSTMNGPSGIGGATGAHLEMTARTSRYSLDDTD